MPGRHPTHSVLSAHLPPPPALARPPTTLFSASFRKSCDAAMPASVRIAVVGDVHDDWNLDEDSKAIQLLQPDLVLFTGDFGEENVELVRSISNLDIPKAVILGNHDCWHTYRFQEKKADRVQVQLRCLGEQHVGYSHLDFPMLKLSVIGGRPFSHGGDQLFRLKLLSQRYGVNNMEQSRKKICNAAIGTPNGHYLVFLSHNGPAGLGSKMDDICGRDWISDGGDHGDPDLAQALHELRIIKRLPVPLVVFGHMHNELAFGGYRKMIVVGDDGTIYLNGAIVPRVKRLRAGGGSSKDKKVIRPDEEVGGSSTLRAFTIVDIEDGRVERVTETWVLISSQKNSVEEEKILFHRSK
ncbi:hypothetical protein AXF42_Ash020714 [Apostasia shenzhenica]|uniref:Calcineurin-like phosphoesterase domain-containing protein n=1 Tax=Apostasia shenzhenica TaxID=1088818 RepID=A0A2H9ZYA7_9ASPA|nr:hypothetical protein AXF42_Ash020714 [Apostasia shenzhenica]